MVLSEFGIDAWAFRYYVTIFVIASPGSDLEQAAQRYYQLLRSRGAAKWYGLAQDDATFRDASGVFSADASNAARSIFGDGGDLNTLRRNKTIVLTNFEKIFFKVRITNGTE